MNIFKSFFIFPLLVIGLFPLPTAFAQIETTELFELNALALIENRDSAKEFLENIKRNDLCFYAVGDGRGGVDITGISEDEVLKWVTREKVPVKVQFSIDPPPPFADEEFWLKVDDFISTYNQLVVLFLSELGSDWAHRKTSASP